MIEEQERNYKFFNPSETSGVLKELIKKIGKYEYKWNKREKRKKKRRESWEYVSVADFVINPSLLFGRFIPHSDEEKENKDKYLHLVIKEVEKIKKGIDYLSTRQKRFIEEFSKIGFEIESFTASLSWRMVIGLGGVHPQETSMTLHHIYGIPYIPGSAIKGVTRHWVIWKEFEGEEEKAEEKENFKKVFGTQEMAGKVIFMDAYPLNEVKLKLDVMTPHYPDYYSSGKPPADWQNPKPINFLTVDKGTKFRFFLLSRDKETLNNAVEWLKGALKEFGIGAKTSVGYGYFFVG
jgi:CRISPR-associated protein Cmr6